MELLVSAGLLLTGPAARRITDGAVLVSDGVVLAAGPHRTVARRAGPDVPRLSFPGGTILPGLIDCHAHLAFDGGSRPDAGVRVAADIDLLLSMAARARALVDSGVTTVRDLGDRGGLAVRLREAIADGTLPGPRILSATAPVVSAGSPLAFLGGAVRDPGEAREAVWRNANAGADLISLLPDGLSPAVHSTVLRSAREVGLPVAAHGEVPGADTVDHCALAGYSGGVGGYVCCGWAASPEHGERILALHEQGTRLVFGSDAGTTRTSFDDIAADLEFHARLGLPVDTVLDMAGVTAAEALGIADTTGRLAPGYRADLLVVPGDPTQDLTTLRTPHLVLADGRCHLPESSLARFLPHP